ncbi:SdrD B-like domain-containing protein [Arundinibacter roseus]|uniref:SD-repeat containing protein B domain-containing protein n=1 Tax=Arundinibacter roseus TaxID=2070510 RepID=A0A4R4K281_9BACT|nr:SdrD B-like domain-containing protein [Arundinibacter roseus]TDB61370.1 hypothetical protein EZE20_19390 [Arundinibacter roseus]
MEIIYKWKANVQTGISLFSRGLGFFMLLFAVAVPAFAQVSGTVYRDFNGDGVRQFSLPTEPGVQGIVVTAFIAGESAPLTSTTDSLGFYSFPVASGKKVRLEFSEMPFETYAITTTATNTSSVQFVTAPIANADLPVSDPLAYCKTVLPDLVTPCYVVGDALAAGSNSGPLASLIFFPYSASGQGSPPIELATTAETGSIWGGVYHRQDQKLFYSALLKRHASLGPLGLGGIYMTDLSSGTPVTSSYLNLSQFVKLSSTADSLALLNRNLPVDFVQPSLDSAAFRLTGKVGLGGMALSPDEKKMWVVNLYEKTLVQINIGAPVRPGNQLTAADITSFSIPNPGCVLGEARPWAVEYQQGSLYVGVTCDARQAGSTRANLRAYVYRFDLKTMQFISTPVISEALSYRKGWVHAGVPQSEYWEPWTDQWSDLTTSLLTEVGGVSYYRASRPQPILSDIAFDTDGSLILGLMDRTGNQTARNQWSVPATSGLYSGYIGGDILRAQAHADGTYALESNGTSGLRVGCGVGNNQGPGGGEFYCADFYRDVFSGDTIQQETFMGSLLVVPGNDEVIASVIEPFTVWSGGMAWFSNQSGNRTKAYEIYNGEGPQLQYAGKSNGLGSIQALCETAPLQIGNRIWIDADQDGIQDPDELPLANVQVALFDSTGNLSGATQTNAAGNYLFEGNDLKPNTTYYLIVGTNGNLAQFDKTTETLTINTIPYKLTSANVGEGPNADLNDSDAQLATGLPAALNGFPYVRVQTGAPGQNNPNYDIGFISCWLEPLPDTTVCQGVTSVQLPAAEAGQLWTAGSGNPSPATISNTGLINGMINAGTYAFILSQGTTCTDTVRVIVNAKPNVMSMIERPTCTDLTVNQDGKISVSGFLAGQTFDLSLGATFTSSMFGSPQPIPGNGTLVSDLQNPATVSQAYTLRIYGETGCTQDIALTLMRRDCACGDVRSLCIPITTRIIKK